MSTSSTRSRITRSIPQETTTELPLPVLPKHRHKKKPKLTLDPDDENVNSFNKVMTNVCDNSDFSRPLQLRDYHKMSYDFRYNFIKMNYEFFCETNVVKCVNEHRLFAYLYDNCSTDKKRRKDIGYVVLKQIA